MVIHVLVNIPQEAARNNANHPESNTSQINPSVALCKRHLASLYHGLVCERFTLDAWELIEFLEQGGTCQLNGLSNHWDARDVEFGDHDAPDIVLCVRDEFVDEDVIVDRVANGAAYDPDCEREGLVNIEISFAGLTNTSDGHKHSDNLRQL